MIVYFVRKYDYLRFRKALWHPQVKTWWAMLRIGLPAGAEFALLFLFILIVYGIIRDFGPAAQAGFGVGSRIMQAMFLPVVALSFAVSPVVGQNFGGRHGDRVRQSVYAAISLAAGIMVLLALVAHYFPGLLLRPFSSDPRVISVGSEYLQIAALNFVAAGIVFSSSSAFQGLGTYDSAAAEFDDAVISLRPPGDAALEAPRFPTAHALVSLRRLTSHSSLREPAPVAARTSPQVGVPGYSRARSASRSTS